MAACLGGSCSFGLPRLLFVDCCRLCVCVFGCFPFGFEGGMWDLIISVPDHCLSFSFGDNRNYSYEYFKLNLNVFSNSSFIFYTKQLDRRMFFFFFVVVVIL